MTNSIEIQTIGPIRMECNNGLNPTPSGSFMQLTDIKAYSWDTGVEINIDKKDCILIDNYNFVPISIIEPQLTVQEWRTMQSKVTTSMFGLGKSLWEEMSEFDEMEELHAEGMEWELGQDGWLDQDFV